MAHDSHVPFGMPSPSHAVTSSPAHDARDLNGATATQGSHADLAGDVRFDVEAAVRESGVFDVVDDLDRELVGLMPVKTRIREIAALLVVDAARRRFGLEADRPTMHMCFTGSPGTGKTTVAMRMATVLNRVGYLSKGHLVAVTRDELVGQYIGHTAPKTREVLKRAMGGVLFIDEAYYLHREENERDYGQEAVEILLQVMENQRENLVVILAGYRDRMDQFFSSNPGMGSRIAHHIDFPDYDLDALMAIAHLMLQEQRYTFTPDAEVAFRELMTPANAAATIRERAKRPKCARTMPPASGQPTRLGSSRHLLGRDDLMRIEAEDVLKSRWFTEANVPSEPELIVVLSI